MNPKHMALAIGLILFALVSMFPPWNLVWIVTRGDDEVFFEGFRFIALPPSKRDGMEPRIYFQMLAIEWVVIASLTGAAWLCCGYKRTPGHGNN